MLCISPLSDKVIDQVGKSAKKNLPAVSSCFTRFGCPAAAKPMSSFGEVIGEQGPTGE